MLPANCRGQSGGSRDLGRNLTIMSAPEPSTIFDTAAAVAAAAKTKTRAGTKASEPHALSAAALAVAAQRFKDAYSPIVVAGIVRVIEIALVAAIGFALYFWSVPPLADSARYYIGAIVGISLLSLLAFQTADIYKVQAFRGHEKQYMRLASAWSVVFLIVISASFFAKAGDMFSRVWLGSFYAGGMVALMASRRLLFLAVRKWTREGR